MINDENFIIGGNTDASIWTSAEACTGIICSCLPAIRALYKTGRSIASEAASNRKATIRSGPRLQQGKSSQPPSDNDHDLGLDDRRNKNGDVMLLRDMGTMALVPSRVTAQEV